MESLVVEAEKFVFDNMQGWGSFSLVVLILIGVIVWQVAIAKRQREIYEKVIEEERAERKEWQATSFTLLREVNEKLYVSLQGVKDVTDIMKEVINSRGGS